MSMKHLQTFESKFYKESDLNYLLDKISSNGFDSLSNSEKNILDVLSTNDSKLDKMIEELSNLSTECKYQMDVMKNEPTGEYKNNSDSFRKWGDASAKMTHIEQQLRIDYELNHDDYKLD